MAHNETAHTEPADKARVIRSRRATPTQRLLTGKQIEQEYGIPYRSLYDLYVSQKLPAVRFKEDGRLWFRREDLEKLIERSVENRAEAGAR